MPNIYEEADALLKEAMDEADDVAMKILGKVEALDENDVATLSEALHDLAASIMVKTLSFALKTKGGEQ